MQTIVILGGGPGGYTAAFKLAALGFSVTVVEQRGQLGGVCLHAGCIPSKTLLHAVDVRDQALGLSAAGIAFSAPVFDLEKLRAHKASVINRLSAGLNLMAKKHGITVLQGTGNFTSHNTLACQTENGNEEICFEHAIIATGSRPVTLPFLPDDPRIFYSDSALELPTTTGKLLIIGGGIIGMEMARIYSGLGMSVTIVEMANHIIPPADTDVLKPLYRTLRQARVTLYERTQVSGVRSKNDGIQVQFSDASGKTPTPQVFDQVLVAVGRQPNTDTIGLETTGISTDAKGFIPVDAERRTNVSHIFAIGDVTGNPMLAHKAMREAEVAAQVIAGKSDRIGDSPIPSVAYTAPEIAWVGKTETDLQTQNISYQASTFPWTACGRAVALGATNGLTKLLFCPESKRLLGAAIVGEQAGELITTLSLGLHHATTLTDLHTFIPPHPSLSETILEAALSTTL